MFSILVNAEYTSGPLDQKKGIQMTLKIQSPEGHEILAALITYAKDHDRKLTIDEAVSEIPSMISVSANSQEILDVLQAYTSDSSICDPQQGKVICIFMDDGISEYKLTADDETCRALMGQAGSFVSPNSIPGDEIYTAKEVQPESGWNTDSIQADETRKIMSATDYPDPESESAAHEYDKNSQISDRLAEAHEEALNSAAYPQDIPSDEKQSLMDQTPETDETSIAQTGFLMDSDAPETENERYAIVEDYENNANFTSSVRDENTSANPEFADNYQAYNSIKQDEAQATEDEAIAAEDQRTLFNEQNLESAADSESEWTSPAPDAPDPAVLIEEEMLTESMIGDKPSNAYAMQEDGYENQAASERLDKNAEEMSSNASGSWFASEPEDAEAALSAADTADEFSEAELLFDEEATESPSIQEVNQVESNADLKAAQEAIDTDLYSDDQALMNLSGNDLSEQTETDSSAVNNASADARDYYRYEGDQIDRSASVNMQDEEGAYDQRQKGVNNRPDENSAALAKQSNEDFASISDTLPETAPESQIALSETEVSVSEKPQAYDINYASDVDARNEFYDEERRLNELRDSADSLRNLDSDDISEPDNSYISPVGKDGCTMIVLGVDGGSNTAYRCYPQKEVDVSFDEPDEIQISEVLTDEAQDVQDENDKLQRKIAKANDRIVQQERKISDHSGQIDRNGSGMMKSLHESQIRHDKKVIDRKERKIAKLEQRIDENNGQLR